jgi:hypothetical protein
MESTDESQSSLVTIILRNANILCDSSQTTDMGAWMNSVDKIYIS